MTQVEVVFFRDRHQAHVNFSITSLMGDALALPSPNNSLIEAEPAIGIERHDSPIVAVLDKLHETQGVVSATSIDGQRGNHSGHATDGKQLLAEAVRRNKLAKQRILTFLSNSETKNLAGYHPKHGEEKRIEPVLKPMRHQIRHDLNLPQRAMQVKHYSAFILTYITKRHEKQNFSFNVSHIYLNN